MDRTKVSGTFDVGSIPAGAIYQTPGFAYETGRFFMLNGIYFNHRAASRLYFTR